MPFAPGNQLGRTHGMTDTPAWISWSGMISSAGRTHNPPACAGTGHPFKHGSHPDEEEK